MDEYKKVKLGDVSTQIRGVSYKPADILDKDAANSTIILRANNIYEDKINYDELVFVKSNRVSEEQYLLNGDILICASSGSKHLVGKAACFNDSRKVSFGAFCKVIRPEGIYFEYLKHYFFSPTYRQLISAASEGANINNIRSEDLENLQIPLPPIETQKQVAATLDKVTRIIAENKKLLEKYDLLIKSRFIEMFGDPVINPMGWKVKKLGELLESIRYGTSTPPKFSESGYAFIRATNIKKGRIIDEDMKYISESESQKIMKCQLKGNEILIVRSGVNSGDTCVVSEKYVNQFAGYDMIIELGKNLNPIYLNELINTNYMDKIVKPLTRRAAQPHLNSEQTQSFPIILPPLELQQQFADFVQQIDKSKFEMENLIKFVYNRRKYQSLLIRKTENMLKMA